MPWAIYPSLALYTHAKTYDNITPTHMFEDTFISWCFYKTDITLTVLQNTYLLYKSTSKVKPWSQFT